jgi:hypothetical protein
MKVIVAGSRSITDTAVVAKKRCASGSRHPQTNAIPSLSHLKTTTCRAIL